VSFRAGLKDCQLHALLDDLDIAKVGIDAPFGWPLEFVEAIRTYSERGEWPTSELRMLRLRMTDRHVERVTTRHPLSVSTDRISCTAMRCAKVLTEYGHRHGRVDRCGAGRIVEIYPAAALQQWGLNARGYKGSKPEQVQRRQELVRQLRRATRSWLALSKQHIADCEQSDHQLDALVAAIVARTAELGLASSARADDLKTAQHEGWIFLPERKPLQALELIR
jgi:predicted nuclease with RNAse H fold